MTGRGSKRGGEAREYLIVGRAEVNQLGLGRDSTDWSNGRNIRSMLKIRFSPFRFSLGRIAPPPRTGREAEARGGLRGADARGRAVHRAFCLRAISLGIFITTAALVRADESAAIRTVLDAQAAAWNRGEIDGFMAGYARSPATTFVSGNEVTRGWQTVRDRYAKKYNSREKMGRLTFSRLTITPLCADTAMVLGSWSLQRKGDRPQGKFTLLFRKLPEGWRIVLDHTS